jgi:hypothetical protein
MNEENKQKRGLANADQETRERVAREGGKASHSGGRPSEDSEGEEMSTGQSTTSDTGSEGDMSEETE